MPYWQSLFFYLLGTQFLGKFLGEWYIWNEAEFALPKGYSGGAHQEGSCESGILSFPSFHTYHIKIKAMLVSGFLVVNHARWLQLLCPPCPWQWQAAMTSTPGDLYRSLTATSAQLRLRSPGWVWRRSQWRRCQGCYIQSWSLQRDVPSWPRLTALSRSKAGAGAWRHWVFHQLVFSVISFVQIFISILFVQTISPLECYIVQRPCNLVIFPLSQILSLGALFVFTLYTRAAIGWTKRTIECRLFIWGLRTINYDLVHNMSFSFVDHSLEWAWQ